MQKSTEFDSALLSPFRHEMLKKFALSFSLAFAACSPAPPTTATSSVRVTIPSAPPATVAEAIQVSTPVANARVTSPLIATGVAPANWFFEAQFHAELLGADGKTIVEAPATALEDWTNGKPTHPFRAELAFHVTADTAATLLLQEDMPPDADSPEPARPTREVRIPITLAAH